MANPQRPKARKPKGFRDAFAADCAQRQAMIGTICDVYSRFGFEQLETPCIEYVDALGKISSRSGSAGCRGFCDERRSG